MDVSLPPAASVQPFASKNNANPHHFLHSRMHVHLSRAPIFIGRIATPAPPTRLKGNGLPTNVILPALHTVAVLEFMGKHDHKQLGMCLHASAVVRSPALPPPRFISVSTGPGTHGFTHPLVYRCCPRYKFRNFEFSNHFFFFYGQPGMYFQTLIFPHDNLKRTIM